MTSKIRVKMGAVEFEFEGTEEFLKTEIPEVLASISKLYRDSGGAAQPTTTPGVTHGEGSQVIGTTATIAAKLNLKSGPDLALAAALRLTVGDGKSSFTRDELLAAMRTATAYHKKSFASNLSNILTALVKAQKFMETATDTYALSAKTQSDLESRLAS